MCNPLVGIKIIFDFLSETENKEKQNHARIVEAPDTGRVVTHELKSGFAVSLPSQTQQPLKPSELQYGDSFVALAGLFTDY